MATIGVSYGKLSVLSESYRTKHGHLYVHCKCDCGKLCTKRKDNLTNHSSCGCVLKRSLIGKKFARLRVVEEVNPKMYRCFCSCGNETVVSSSNLNSRGTQSCGCLTIELGKEKLPAGESGLRYLYKHYKRNAKTRSFDFSLTLEEFKTLTSSNCHYCGEAPSRLVTKMRKHGEYIYNGIDRVNNDIGYCISNCVSCCYYCNVAKAARSVTDFLNWAKRIADKNG